MNGRSSLSSGDLLADRRFAYAEGAREDGDAEAARDLYHQTLELAPHWPPAHFGLAKALLLVGDTQGAQAALERAIALDPADQLGAAALRASLPQAEAAAGTMPDAYVAALFDEYAPRFDTHLVEKLGYCAPDLLIQALEAAGAPLRFSHVLDLGCGTGLMAKALAGRGTRMTGVDLSRAMLAEAQRSGFYTRLEQAELAAFLSSEADLSADLIIAADVFCYVPDLAPSFVEARRILAKNGLFAFTIQTHQGEGAIVGADQRVHHAIAHVEALAQAHGFVIRHRERASSRVDRGQPVPGAVFVLA